nr:T9SS type A sorting domain-containing protein [Saprospiraceae bacterium]
GTSCDEARVELARDPSSVYPGALNIDADKNERVTFVVPSHFDPPANHFIDGGLNMIAPGVWEYQPLEAYVGSDRLPFFNISGGNPVYYEVTINYTDAAIHNGWNAPDRVFTETSNSIQFDVRKNDFHGSVVDVINPSLEGSLAVLGNGVYRYTPDDGFAGTTHFDYVTCRGTTCDTATVTLVVHDFLPIRQDWHFLTQKNSSIDLPYQVPIDQFYFEVDQFPLNGVLELSSDGKGLHYTPQEDFIGHDLALVEYCTRNGGRDNCTTLALYFAVTDDEVPPHCESHCLYPGDLNNDGLVSISDVLPLGIHLGASGHAREDQTIEKWYGRMTTSWRQSAPIGVRDLSYVDADGDGSIGLQDLNATALHYGRAHKIVPSWPFQEGNVPILLELQDPTVSAGDEAVIEVSLGTPSAQVSAMLGFNFSVEINDQFVDSSTLHFDLISGGILDEDDGILAYSYSPRDGQLDVGFSKFDQKEIEGYGVLGEIRFIVEEDLNGFRRFPDLEFDIKVDKVQCLDSYGHYMSLPGGAVQTSLRPSNAPSAFSVYPVPATDQLTIDAPFEIKGYRLTDIYGRMLLEGQEPSGRTTVPIDLGGLAPGVYVLEVDGATQTLSSKIQVVR